MNAICLVVDRLHAGYVGAYGNPWMETSAFDRLASQSAVFDQFLVDSPCLERLYRSYWQGRHALCPELPNAQSSLAALLREAGVATALLTDEPRVRQHPLAVDFDELIEVDPPWQPRTAPAIDQTHFARCFTEMIEWLESARGPFLLWCHLGGLGTTWDAPLTFREAYREEGDPAPPEEPEVPERMLAANHDPDELLGIRQAYAGQVTLLDTCLGAFLDLLDGLPVGQESLLALVSSRGFALGEHLRVGPCDEPLFGELVHAPCVLRLPDEEEDRTTMRSQALVEPSDLWATLLDWWKVDAAPRSSTAGSWLPIVRGQSDAIRDRLGILGDHGQRGLRTPGWYLRAGIESELYAKPDDRWEVNDVASRARDVVESLQDVLVQYERALPVDGLSGLPPLRDACRSAPP